ncbi:unnamed protein product [Thelazia callipaeda]|uniref:Uncharacterized protein n=1 Tax=Thelazia callipaeda TaxID=103827 RepID=A0A0N5D8N9_THECL|nr:unnamed protein product [Thelazia callipaeda]
MERELSESPSSKRPRLNQTTPVATTSLISSAIASQQQLNKNVSVLEKEEALDVSKVPEIMDEKSDITVSRKVPPLRISLPRTPSEDGAAISNFIDDGTSATSVGRRNSRNTKNPIRRHQSPDQSSSANACDESVQRVTRSKLKQFGRQLRDPSIISCELSAKKKSSGWRRGSTSTASLMPMASVGLPDEHSTSMVEAIDRAESTFFLICENKLKEIAAEDSSHIEPVAQKEDENTLLALSLMKQNAYEGFRSFRAVIEERWAKDATKETPIPEHPPNYENYMIVRGNYTSASNIETLPFQEKTDNEFLEKLTAKLRTLYLEQQEKRKNMQIYHQVERERLQMQAESEALRMLARKANEGYESFSAMRMIRETNLFNTGFLEVKPKQLPIMEVSEVKEKFSKLANSMHIRQKMEADALFAEQLFTWNAAIQRSEDSTLVSLKNVVPRVPVVPLILNL